MFFTVVLFNFRKTNFLLKQQARSPEPVYAQVNREKKKGRHSDIQLLANEQPDSMPAGDSWV